MNKILIVGATSAIATSFARLKANQSAEFVLLARNKTRCQVLADDLLVRGASKVHTLAFDATEPSAYGSLVDKAFELLGRVDVVLVAHGTLPDQKQCETDFPAMQQALLVNGSSVASLLFYVSQHMVKQGLGTIAVISSVAGDRGRQSNFVYGAAKAMVSTYLQGLRNRLFDHNVHVLDIKPGFVDTPMTAEFPKGPLWAKPETIAAGIDQAIRKRKNTVYLPFFWRFIMMIICSIPEPIFKRLKL